MPFLPLTGLSCFFLSFFFGMSSRRSGTSESQSLWLVYSPNWMKKTDLENWSESPRLQNFWNISFYNNVPWLITLRLEGGRFKNSNFFSLVFILLGVLWHGFEELSIIFSNISSVPTFLFLLVFSLHTVNYTFCYCPIFLGYSDFLKSLFLTSSQNGNVSICNSPPCTSTAKL